MSAEEDLQREITRAALRALQGTGFALAGSGAIREHGLVERPTRDVDLFTSDPDVAAFDSAVNELVDALRQGAGLDVEEVRRAERFAQLRVTTGEGQSVDMDLAVDWRESEPVTLLIGPVLSLGDAVGNKVSALYSRAEARDYLDVDAIRASGKFTDQELIGSAAERDAGFEVAMFARQLDQVQRLTPERVAEYGVDVAQLDAIKGRFEQWSTTLRGDTPAVQEHVEKLRRLANRNVPILGSDGVKPPSSPSSPRGQGRGI